MLLISQCSPRISQSAQTLKTCAANDFFVLFVVQIIVLAFFIAFPAVAQDEKVCMGATVAYVAEGLKDSEFEYKLADGGKIIQTYTDSIVVEWGYTKSRYQLVVQEISQYGCEGGWAFLNVEVVGDYAQFTQPEYEICDNGGVTVEFNQSDFKDWEWVGNTNPVGKDGYIIRPGKYELKTTDWNNCILISSIEVVVCETPTTPPETIKVFNTFTPNDDGDNDVWNIPSLMYYPNCVVEVFDRWGRKVFTSTRGYTSPWNGRDFWGRHLPMETYYYIIHLNDVTRKEPIRGSITIIR
jgi:gliding motility-associated-like protein